MDPELHAISLHFLAHKAEQTARGEALYLTSFLKSYENMLLKIGHSHTGHEPKLEQVCFVKLQIKF